LIAENVRAILAELPPGVELVAAAKTRTAAEILEAVGAGVRIIGENYVQEAADVFPAVGRAARWHFIGHLQKNKAGKAVEIFDMIETVDSAALAREIDKRSAAAGKTMLRSCRASISSKRQSRSPGAALATRPAEDLLPHKRPANLRIPENKPTANLLVPV